MARNATFAERLNEALKVRGKKAIEISRETGIDQGSLSNWRHGRYDATQTGIYLLARSLNVSEAWLMGYDVPMERPIETPTEFTYAMHIAETDLTERDKDILIQMAKQLADANRRHK